MDAFTEQHTGIGGGRSAVSAPDSLRAVRKAHIEKVLNATHDDLQRTAEILGVPMHELRGMMRQLGIS